MGPRLSLVYRLVLRRLPRVFKREGGSVLPLARRKACESHIQLAINSAPHKCKIIGVTIVVGAAKIAQELNLTEHVLHPLFTDPHKAVMSAFVFGNGLAAQLGPLGSGFRSSCHDVFLSLASRLYNTRFRVWLRRSRDCELLMSVFERWNFFLMI